MTVKKLKAALERHPDSAQVAMDINESEENLYGVLSVYRATDKTPGVGDKPVVILSAFQVN